jgi:hypothetical protein
MKLRDVFLYYAKARLREWLGLNHEQTCASAYVTTETRLTALEGAVSAQRAALVDNDANLSHAWKHIRDLEDFVYDDDEGAPAAPTGDPPKEPPKPDPTSLPN